MSKQTKYHLKTGKEGESQLDNLDYFFGKSSRQFLTQVGLSEGMHVLDVGCGVGNLTCWLAEQVGTTGKVLGVDFDQKQIEVARQRAEARGIRNVSFEQADAHDLSLYKAKYDLAYCRCLLIHVNNPANVVTSMANTLRKNGILACEVGSHHTVLYYPSFAVFDRLRNKLVELLKLSGNDICISENVINYAKKLKGFEFNAKLNQGLIYDTSEIKKFTVNFTLVLNSISDALIEHHLLSAQEIEEIRVKLNTHIIHEDTILFLSRMTQIWCRRLS